METNRQEYHHLAEKYSAEAEDLGKTHRMIGYIRLVLTLFILYLIYSVLADPMGMFSFLILIVAICIFVWLIRHHQLIGRKKEFTEILLTINKDEIAFLAGDNSYETGSEFSDPRHLYSHDLDLFGRHSLFQYLNRTATFLGGHKLADALLTRLPKNEILPKQEAIAELVPMLTLRQHVLALARQYRDSSSVHNNLVLWAGSKRSISAVVIFMTHVFPLLLIGLLISFIITGQAVLLNMVGLVFIINLTMLGRYHKKIREELFDADKIDRIFQQYAFILEQLEKQDFTSDLMRSLNGRTSRGEKNASTLLYKLSRLMAQLESINNGLVALIFSGIGCYHLFILRDIYRWKNLHAGAVLEWIDVIAEFEVLSSLATFKYNNLEFAFPEISDQVELNFSAMGHPLVPCHERVGNDISFDQYRFFILTGSNMSGKSTFLRSLGVNIILAGAGAPVCAMSATVYPFQVLVSMRVDDSLADHESYFYAEVKRLKRISDELGREGTLVLLDEILRGTNSDDKRNGTLQVIRRMVREGVYGVIATHDLEVCKEALRHPEVLANKCFEVEIKDDELFFDYKLRDGVCENQSASFLMKKTGII